MQKKHEIDLTALKKTDAKFFSDSFFSDADRDISLKLSIKLIPLVTQTHTYLINTRYLYNPDSKELPIIMSHGIGSPSTWATWIKQAIVLYAKGYSILMFDQPGFGHSTCDDRDRTNPKVWLEDGPNMLVGLLDSFNFKKVTAFMRCGAAALAIRTMAAFPERFGPRHIISNSMISGLPVKFQQTLKDNNMKLLVFWCEDPDHLRSSVGYKWFKKQHLESNGLVILQDLEKDDLSWKCINVKKMGRDTDYVCIFGVSKGFSKFAIEFLEGKSTKFESDQKLVDLQLV